MCAPCEQRAGGETNCSCLHIAAPFPRMHPWDATGRPCWCWGPVAAPPPAPASGVLHSNLWEAQFRLEEQRTHFGTFGEVSLAALKNVCYYHSFPPPPPICCFAGLLLSKERSCLSKQRKGNFLKKKERKGELVRRKAEGGKMHPRVGCFLKLAEKWGEAGLCCWGRVVQQNSLIPNI